MIKSEENLSPFLIRALKDNYVNITGEMGKRKITYITSNNYSDNYDDPEEKVRAEFWAELIYKYDYPVNRIKVEVTVPDRLPSNRADIVVFYDDECKRPYAVVECKKEGVTDAEFNQAIEQGVGNATWVKLRADYVVIIAGVTRRVLDVSDKFGIFEREQNIVADLPKTYGKVQEYRFYRGTENDIKSVAMEDLIITIKKCHQTLWGGGRLSPPTAFGELCKLIFVKISDEQKTSPKDPYQFQIRTHETSARLAERINFLYNEQKMKDPEVFTESIKVDDRVLRTVVSHLEAINLSKTDLDVKGVAFEQFMDGFFKGDFGQYFTPRPIIEFIVKMMKPEHDWDVLDPSCGSGGFLLHALDYVRNEAKRRYPDEGDRYDIEACFKYWHNFAEKHLYGIEINDEIARVAKMNMIVHDDGHTNVISHDALENIEKINERNKDFDKDKFDLILTNPPFGSIVNKDEKPYLGNYELGNSIDAKGRKKARKNQNSEILFIERIWEFLKFGTGKAAIVLPDGILTNSSSQYVRDFILEKFQLLAVISLPQCAFAHFGAGVKASIIFVRKRRQDEKASQDEAIFMAAPEWIGYDATGRKTESQFEEILKKYEEFQNDPESFFV
ncbi:N-6 DNA methylase [bacterium]|nr:N-6 DNA methylase [bacterium]